MSTVKTNVANAALVLLIGALTAQVATGPVTADGAPARLSPVWSLGVENGRAVVLHNELNKYDVPFPLPAVRLYDVDFPARPSAGGVRTQGPRVAVLLVSPDGQLLSDISYLPYNSVGRGQNGTEPVVVVGEKTTPVNGVSSFDPLHTASASAAQFRKWTPFDEEGSGLLFTTDQTVVFSAAHPVLRLPYVGYEGSYARAARIGVVCAFHLGPGKSEPEPEGSPGSLIVFDLGGNVLQEVRFEPGRGLNQLHVSNDGTWVMATEQGEGASIASDRVLWVDVVNGTKEYIPGVAGGYRHHSDDGKYMAVVQGGWGKVHLFSMSTPASPTRVSEYGGEDLVVSASINQDGSLVAVVLSSRIGPGRRAEQRVLILDRDMQTVGVAGLNPESSVGVTIVGEFLFVGFQTDELPRYDVLVPSKHIDLFHVGSLR